MLLTQKNTKGYRLSGRGYAPANGVTLVELLIAAALLGLVSLGFGFIYVVAQRNFVRNANFVIAQSEAAYAMEHIKRNLFLASAISVPAVGDPAGETLTFTSQPDLGQPTITSTYQRNGMALVYQRDSGSFTPVAGGVTQLIFDRQNLYSLRVTVQANRTTGGDTQVESLTSTVTPRGIF